MKEPLETLARPNAAMLRELAASAEPAISPAVIRRTGSEMVNLRLSSRLTDELDAAERAEDTTRKVIVTRALAVAGYNVPARDLEHRTPQRRSAA